MLEGTNHLWLPKDESTPSGQFCSLVFLGRAAMEICFLGELGPTTKDGQIPTDTHLTKNGRSLSKNLKKVPKFDYFRYFSKFSSRTSLGSSTEKQKNKGLRSAFARAASALPRSDLRPRTPGTFACSDSRKGERNGKKNADDSANLSCVGRFPAHVNLAWYGILLYGRICPQVSSPHGRNDPIACKVSRLFEFN